MRRAIAPVFWSQMLIVRGAMPACAQDLAAVDTRWLPATSTCFGSKPDHVAANCARSDRSTRAASAIGIQNGRMRAAAERLRRAGRHAAPST